MFENYLTYRDVVYHLIFHPINQLNKVVTLVTNTLRASCTYNFTLSALLKNSKVSIPAITDILIPVTSTALPCTDLPCNMKRTALHYNALPHCTTPHCTTAVHCITRCTALKGTTFHGVVGCNEQWCIFRCGKI